MKLRATLKFLQLSGMQLNGLAESHFNFYQARDWRMRCLQILKKKKDEDFIDWKSF